MATTSASRRHTKAWAAFEQNLDSIMHMLALVCREEASLKTASARFATSAARVTNEVTRLKTSLGKSPGLLLPPLEKALANFTRSSERYKKTRETGRERIGTVHLWQVVMLVTCVEVDPAELHGALRTVGLRNRKLPRQGDTSKGELLASS